MFEDGPEPAWEQVEHLMTPPPEPGPQPWEAPDFDAWIDQLAAADPERPMTVGEILAAAEHGPIDAVTDVQLAALDADTLSDEERLSLAVAATRRENRAAGMTLSAVGAFAGPMPRDDLGEAAFAWAEIAAALRLGEGAARSLVGLARQLRQVLPATLAAMQTGDLSCVKARALATATAALSDGDARKVEERVLDKAAGRNPAQHASAVNYHVAKVDPAGAEKRRQRKLADVALIRQHHGDGVADVIAANIDSVDAEAIWLAADSYARRCKGNGDERTLEALRVGFLVEAARHFLSTGRFQGPADDEVPTSSAPASAPTRNAEPALVNVIVPLPTALGVGDAPGVLAGAGEPLPAAAIADLLHHAAGIRFALADGAGRLVGISTVAHDPMKVMRAFVALRDLCVRVPGGSTAPVPGHDLDHIDPRGPTDPANLQPASRGWHRAKTFGHWTVSANSDGTITWSSRRTGRTYTTHPFDHRNGP